MTSRHTRSAGFTRPADTTTYAAGDAMGSGTDPGACILKFNPNHSGARGRGKIVSARLSKTDESKVTADTFRLYLFRAAPSSDPDDNGAWTTSWIKEADQDSFIGQIDFETAEVHANFIQYEGQDMVPSSGIPFHTPSGIIYGILTPMGAYEPASAEAFRIQLEIED